MKRLFSVYLILAVALTCGTDAAQSQQPGLADTHSVLDGRMLPGEEVATFERSETLYPVEAVSCGNVIRPLPVAGRRLKNIIFRVGDKQYDLFDYLAVNRVAGLLILKGRCSGSSLRCWEVKFVERPFCTSD